MPRTLDYPRASLERCLELAAAVHDLGDDCTLSAAAERIGARPGGAFHAIVSAAGRYGLLVVRRGRLRTDPVYRTLRLAYDAAERERAIASALANVPLFRELLERFDGAQIPQGHLDRVLVREYRVPERSAERIAGYFLEGARAAGLLAGGRLRAIDRSGGAREDARPDAPRAVAPQDAPASRDSVETPAMRAVGYRVHVAGPGLDSRVDVTGADDLDLVRALVAKLERAVRG